MTKPTCTCSLIRTRLDKTISSLCNIGNPVVFEYYSWEQDDLSRSEEWLHTSITYHHIRYEPLNGYNYSHAV